VIDHRRRAIAFEDRIEADRELEYELEQLATVRPVGDHRVHHGLETYSHLRPVAAAECGHEVARQMLEPDGRPEIRLRGQLLASGRHPAPSPKRLAKPVRSGL
jgi:hypothetical protein